MDRNTVKWRGYIPAITTPFNQNGELCENSIRKLVSWLVSEGMHGIIVAGTTGEWFSLSNPEREKLISNCCNVVDGRIPVIVGCTSYTAKESISHAITAKQLGADGILLTPPPYARPSNREIYEFYKTVNDRVKIPICVYNWPPGTNIDMDLELLSKLADLDHVVAIKNSTKDKNHFMKTFFALKDKVRVFGVPMTAEGAELVLKENADGTMGAGAVLGHIQPDFFNALWKNDLNTAMKSSELDQFLMKAWFKPDFTAKFGSAQAVFKAALRARGLPGGYPRDPIMDLRDDEIKLVRKALDDIEMGVISSNEINVNAF